MNNRLYRLFSALFAILCINGSISLGFAEDFVVGTTSGYAPYVSLNEKGEYEGFDIDMANELSQKLNRKLIIKDLGNMPSLLVALKQGKIDAIIWAISITEERQKQMEMIYYQGEKVTKMPLLFWKIIPENIATLEDLGKHPSFVIVAEAGSYQDTVLRSVPTINLKQVDKVLDAILEIKYGKATATMIDTSLVPVYTKRFSEVKVLEIPLPSAQQSLGNGICLNKSNTALIAEVAKATEELRFEGKITALEKKWNLVNKDNL